MYDSDMMDKFGTVSSSYVGKEFKLRDAKDPLGAQVNVSSANFDEWIAQFKLY